VVRYLANSPASMSDGTRPEDHIGGFASQRNASPAALAIAGFVQIPGPQVMLTSLLPLNGATSPSAYIRTKFSTAVFIPDQRTETTGPLISTDKQRCFVEAFYTLSSHNSPSALTPVLTYILTLNSLQPNSQTLGDRADPAEC
jgi:hypothetical protein